MPFKSKNLAIALHKLYSERVKGLARDGRVATPFQERVWLGYLWWELREAKSSRKIVKVGWERVTSESLENLIRNYHYQSSIYAQRLAKLFDFFFSLVGRVTCKN